MIKMNQINLQENKDGMNHKNPNKQNNNQKKKICLKFLKKNNLLKLHLNGTKVIKLNQIKYPLRKIPIKLAAMKSNRKKYKISHKARLKMMKLMKTGKDSKKFY